ncbi:uncharacterized protein B0J16DRAFT_370073 [Fusarium flagelliforme]|uniref:Secreted protein n=1 Tax=Fusarium flagelliforme TaxID=2675880 RepID=A0A395MEK8_9HYPO|nr:uncharacterized protein B0J16DRAFT_370073 [Fusarium flagelliforme]KAH7188053.1 hypothetical protein B0J16DRAFT_370073 [Fusarium flagelliforme]RFN46286.1 hypothetical protein FIE12Z_9483 [Fusarium flagelliforme]
MRFDTTALFALLATTCAADSMTVNTRCTATNCNKKDARFFTDAGSYAVSGEDGCRGTGVPGMTDFCIDWSRGRGHFKYSHQSSKRCMLMRSEVVYGCDWHQCRRSEWAEVPCNWRLANPGADTTLATVSAPAAAVTEEAMT